MTDHYRDYFWKDGIPFGINKIDDPEFITYKIVMDPYRKRISIEKYQDLVFEEVIYDSAFLNFRHLKAENTHAFQKTVISETSNSVICHIRDQDDRLLFKETHLFENNLCRECRVHSPHDIPLSIQRIYYKMFQDPYNGVILFDRNAHPVVFKHYEFDDTVKEFTELIETVWNMQGFICPQLLIKTKS